MKDLLCAVIIAGATLAAPDRAVCDTLLTNVTLVDIETGRPAEAQSVLIEGVRIAKIGTEIAALWPIAEQ